MDLFHNHLSFRKGDLSFYISQSIHNFPILLLIRMRLGFGKIRFQLSEGMVHYVIEDQASLVQLCILLNGRFRTTAKYTSFNILVSALKMRRQIYIPIITLNKVMNYNWLAGFTDADGSFFVSIAKVAAMSLGYQVTINISWTQKSREVLDFIQVNFGGSIVFNKTTLAYCLTIKAKPASPLGKEIYYLFLQHIAYEVLNV